MICRRWSSLFCWASPLNVQYVKQWAAESRIAITWGDLTEGETHLARTRWSEILALARMITIKASFTIEPQECSLPSDLVRIYQKESDRSLQTRNG